MVDGVEGVEGEDEVVEGVGGSSESLVAIFEGFFVILLSRSAFYALVRTDPVRERKRFPAQKSKQFGICGFSAWLSPNRIEFLVKMSEYWVSQAKVRLALPAPRTEQY